MESKANYKSMDIRYLFLLWQNLNSLKLRFQYFRLGARVYSLVDTIVNVQKTIKVNAFLCGPLLTC